MFQRLIAITAVVMSLALPATINWNSCRQPVYPRESDEAREEGNVAVSLDVDAHGRVLTSGVKESSGHPRLDGAARRTIAKCTFSRARFDGSPQPTSVIVRFNGTMQH